MCGTQTVTPTSPAHLVRRSKSTVVYKMYATTSCGLVGCQSVVLFIADKERQQHVQQPTSPTAKCTRWPCSSSTVSGSGRQIHGMASFKAVDADGAAAPPPSTTSMANPTTSLAHQERKLLVKSRYLFVLDCNSTRWQRRCAL